MKTDDLLAALAADTAPRRSVRARLMRALPTGLLLSAIALTLIWGFRPDVMAALASVTVLKTLAPVLLATLAVPLALSLSRPDPSPQPLGWVLVALGAVAFAIFGLALLEAGGSGLIDALMVPSLVVCFVSVPVLALPILGAVLWALSAGAPLDTGRTGLVSGLVAGFLSTAIYSLYCDQDGLLFFLPAYAAAIGLVAFLGKIAGQRALRW